MQRWRGSFQFLFIIRFFTLLFFLLLGYRSSFQTLPNQIYLFSLAQSACVLINFIGVHTQVERPELYWGKESEVRAILGHLSPFVNPMEPLEKILARARPLSAWEIFQYRVTIIRKKHNELVEMKQNLERSFRAKIVETPEEHYETLATRYKALKIIFDSPRIFIHKNNEITQVIARLERDLRTACEMLNQPTPEFIEILQEVDKTLVRIFSIFEKALTTEIATMTYQLQRMGPTIFVGSPSKHLSTPCPEKEPFVFTVGPDCGAGEILALFMAAVFSFPSPLKRKISTILIFVPILYGANLFRVASLGLIGYYLGKGEIFQFIHVHLWTALLTFIAAGMWIYWITTLKPYRAHESDYLHTRTI